jgi:hypothetical protein
VHSWSRFLKAAAVSLGVLLPAALLGNPRIDAWKKSELNESYMRTLTKHQCMLKSVGTLKLGCRTRECLLSVGAIIGDCVHWASGDHALFCASFKTEYVGSYCATNDLDARACTVIHTSYESLCVATPR